MKTKILNFIKAVDWKAVISAFGGAAAALYTSGCTIIPFFNL